MRRLLTPVAILCVLLVAMPVLADSGAGKGTLLNAKPEPRSFAAGAVWVTVDGARLHLVFNAHGTEPARGHIVGRTDAGEWFVGRALCYMQEGNRAAFSGPVTLGTYGEGYFLVQVEDNGQGAKASGPDRVRLQFEEQEPECALPAEGADWLEVERGALRMHEAPAAKEHPAESARPTVAPELPLRPPGPEPIPDAWPKPKRPILPLP